jgi:hypothetical protein
VGGLGRIAAAAAVFAGTHFLLSHPAQADRRHCRQCRIPRHLLGCCGGDARMARARLSCRTCRHTVVAGRRRAMGGGNCRDAVGVDPADGLDSSQPGASQFGIANPGAGRGARRLRRHPASDDVGIRALGYLRQGTSLSRPRSSFWRWSERRCRIVRRRRSARHLARMGKEDQVLAVWRDRLR